MSYDFNEHRHRYAVWTAARAVQRNFATTQKVEAAIKTTNLRDFCESSKSYTHEEFDQWHQQCAQLLMDFFEENKPYCSYGRAAKIIAIYLKTSVILSGKAQCGLAEIIHPPIDRILLNGVAETFGLNNLKTINWTKLEKDAYWSLVSNLRIKCPYFDWRLEEAWKTSA